MPSLGDLIFALAQWLRTTPLVEVSRWISKTQLSEVVQANFWTIPTAQTIHILAIAAAFGSVGMINLRILGVAGVSRTIPQIAARYVPWIWWSLLTLIGSGIVMIIGEPIRELINPCFWIKMALVVVAAMVGLGFQASVRRYGDWWGATPERRGAMRAGAGAVIGLWCLIMVLGRWIAYAPI